MQVNTGLSPAAAFAGLALLVIGIIIPPRCGGCRYVVTIPASPVRGDKLGK
jgi:hypothetical protein